MKKKIMFTALTSTLLTIPLFLGVNHETKVEAKSTLASGFCKSSEATSYISTFVGDKEEFEGVEFKAIKGHPDIYYLRSYEKDGYALLEGKKPGKGCLKVVESDGEVYYWDVLVKER